MNRSIVVKLGGATIEQDGVIEELAADLRDMPDVFSIVVHGGGSEIGRYLELLGKEFTFVNGLRVTDGDRSKSWKWFCPARSTRNWSRVSSTAV